MIKSIKNLTIAKWNDIFLVLLYMLLILDIILSNNVSVVIILLLILAHLERIYYAIKNIKIDGEVIIKQDK